MIGPFNSTKELNQNMAPLNISKCEPLDRFARVGEESSRNITFIQRVKVRNN